MKENSPIKVRMRENNILAQHTSNSREHYTPSDVIESCRWLMGKIDLDPASTPLANSVVKADRIYTVHDDGLSQPWVGNVYLNPPGGDTAKVRPDMQQLSRSYPCIWWAKLIFEWLNDRTTQACFLAFQLNLLQAVQATGLDWSFFHFPIVYFKDRLSFGHPVDTINGLPKDGTSIREGNAPPGGSALVWLPPKDLYCKDELARFQIAFKSYGAVQNVAIVRRSL